MRAARNSVLGLAALALLASIASEAAAQQVKRQRIVIQYMPAPAGSPAAYHQGGVEEGARTSPWAVHQGAVFAVEATSWRQEQQAAALPRDRLLELTSD